MWAVAATTAVHRAGLTRPPWQRRGRMCGIIWGVLHSGALVILARVRRGLRACESSLDRGAAEVQRTAAGISFERLRASFEGQPASGVSQLVVGTESVRALGELLPSLRSLVLDGSHLSSLRDLGTRLRDLTKLSRV